MTSDPKELMPCPFCGGKPTHGSCDMDNGHVKYYVACCGKIDSYEKGKEVEWWNTRASHPREVEEVKSWEYFCKIFNLHPYSARDWAQKYPQGIKIKAGGVE